MLPPTLDQQAAAMDTLVRMALTDSQISSDLPRMLSTLQGDAPQRVATILVMLAGACLPDAVEWKALLQQHIEGADA